MQEYQENNKKTYWSRDEALILIRKYCAFQERCHQEVRYKLIQHGIYGDLLKEIISELITEDFLNEERFARSFTRGKFRMKQWGKNKIKQELKKRDISPYCIKESMSEINDQEYQKLLKNLLSKKEKISTYKNSFDRQKKLTDYALSKGYEYETIQIILSENNI